MAALQIARKCWRIFALLIRNSSAASGIFWILTTTVTTNKFSVCDRLKRKGGKHHENKAGFCNGRLNSNDTEKQEMQYRKSTKDHLAEKVCDF